MNHPSSGPAAKQALLTRFAAATTAPVKVHRNRPNTAYAKEQDVYVEDIINGTRDYPALGAGRGPVEEEYKILVAVELTRKGTDGDAAEAAIVAIVEALEAAIYEEIHLTSQVWESIPTDFDLNSTSGKDGWECIYTFAVAIKARI